MSSCISCRFCYLSSSSSGFCKKFLNHCWVIALWYLWLIGMANALFDGSFRCGTLIVALVSLRHDTICLMSWCTSVDVCWYERKGDWTWRSQSSTQSCSIWAARQITFKWCSVTLLPDDLNAFLMMRLWCSTVILWAFHVLVSLLC